MGRNNGGNALAIFAMIIAIGSLALSGYMFLLEEQPIEGEEWGSSTNGSTKTVGDWWIRTEKPAIVAG